MALIVVVLLTVIGPVYRVPDVGVGILPSVVYRIEAPLVNEVKVTVCDVCDSTGKGLKLTS
ncbi:hypothetical protein D3C85_1753260 [compost metagenome]